MNPCIGTQMMQTHKHIAKEQQIDETC